jgi:hypothetical protein
MSVMRRWECSDCGAAQGEIHRAGCSHGPRRVSRRFGAVEVEYVRADAYRGAVEDRDAYAKLVALYREYGSPDLTRLVNFEAMRTPPAGGQ